LSREIKYILGNASGYYKPLFIEQVGPYHLGEFLMRQVEIRNPQSVNEVDFDELKVGNYHQPIRKVQDIKVFIKDTEYFEISCNDILFTNIEIEDELLIDGEKLFRFKAEAIFKLKKNISQPASDLVSQTDDQKGFLSNFLQSFFASTTRYFSDGGKQFGFGDNTRTSDSAESNTIISSQGSKLLGMLGAIIIAILLYLVIRFIFGNGLLVWIIVSVFLLRVFGGVFNRTSVSNLSVIHPIRNLIGLLFLIYAFYALFKQSDPNAWIYLFLGSGLMINARYSAFLRLLGSALIFLSLFLFYRASQNIIDSDDDTESAVDDTGKVPNPEEDSEIKYDGEDTVQIDYLKHNLKWRDNRRVYYSGTFRIQKDHFFSARDYRDRLDVQASNSKEYWNKVYSNISNNNKNLLEEVVREYKKIAKKKKLSRNQFADMIVTSVQNIPYYLVHDLTHKDAEKQYGGFITEYHRSGKPCLEKMKFGIQSPSEFIGNLKGDCDTRSCFLYNVLNSCGIPTIILASDRYGHAVIGVSGNYSGDNIRYNGIKYYAWETTNTGFVPGALSPECNNMRYWFVALGTNVKQ
jgi:hypothetical protein